MVDPGCPEHIVALPVDEAPLAGDEGGRDRAGLPADGIGDPPGQGVAGVVRCRRETQHPGKRTGRWLDLDLPDEGADGAEAAKIGIAGEVVTARPGRLGRRQKSGVGSDEVAGLQGLRGLVGRPDTGRALLGRQRAEGLDEDDQACALFPLVEGLDEAGERRDGGAGEHRTRHPRHAPGTGRETKERRDERQQNRPRHGPCRAERQQGAEKGCEPDRRRQVGLADRDGEINQDAGSEGDGEPRKQAPLIHLFGETIEEPSRDATKPAGGPAETQAGDRPCVPSLSPATRHRAPSPQHRKK